MTESRKIKLNEAIINLVQLAKSEYGEHIKEFVGYKVGSIWLDDWDDIELVPIGKIKESSFCDEKISDDDLLELYLTNEDFFTCENEVTIIKRCYEIKNDGWQLNLHRIINNIK